jgi:hypothetical protein
VAPKTARKVEEATLRLSFQEQLPKTTLQNQVAKRVLTVPATIVRPPAEEATAPLAGSRTTWCDPHGQHECLMTVPSFLFPQFYACLAQMHQLVS